MVPTCPFRIPLASTQVQADDFSRCEIWHFSILKHWLRNTLHNICCTMEWCWMMRNVFCHHLYFDQSVHPILRCDVRPPSLDAVCIAYGWYWYLQLQMNLCAKSFRFEMLLLVIPYETQVFAYGWGTCVSTRWRDKRSQAHHFGHVIMDTLWVPNDALGNVGAE